MGFLLSIASAVLGGGVAALLAPSSVQPVASVGVALLVGLLTVLFVPPTSVGSNPSKSSSNSSKSKQKQKKEKAKKSKAKASAAAVASSTDEDEDEENETPSSSSSSVHVPLAKSSSAPAKVSVPPVSSSATDDDDEDDEEEGSKATQSKSAKKKAKKKEAERKKKEEEAKKKAEEEALQRQKEEEARRAAAAAAEQERRKAEEAAAAAATAATSSKKKKKAANGTAAAAAAAPAAPVAAPSKASAPAATPAVAAPAASKSIPHKATAAAVLQPQLNSFNHHEEIDDGGEWTQIKSTSSNKAKQAAAASRNTAASSSSSSSSSSAATTIEPADREITVEVNVPNKYHQALIVGKNGATVKLLKEATQVEISMPKKESADTTITLRGVQSKVSQCKGAIDSIISNGYSSITHPGFVHDDIFIPKSLLGAVFGKAAENIQNIQRKTNTIITSQNRTSTSSSSSEGEKVVIAGVKEEVKAAKLAIKQLMTEQFSPLTHEGWEKVTIEVPSYKLGAVIGKKGCNLNHVENTCDKKIKIIIPRADATSGGDVTIVIAGVPDMIARAHKMIMAFITPEEETTSKDDEDEEDAPREPLAEADDPFSAQNTIVNPDSLW